MRRLFAFTILAVAALWCAAPATVHASFVHPIVDCHSHIAQATYLGPAPRQDNPCTASPRATHTSPPTVAPPTSPRVTQPVTAPSAAIPVPHGVQSVSTPAAGGIDSAVVLVPVPDTGVGESGHYAIGFFLIGLGVLMYLFGFLFLAGVL